MPTIGRTAKGATAFLVSLSLLAALPAVPALGLSKTACRVTNTDTLVVKTSLAGAVAAVTAPGQHLTVRGVCKGITTIAGDLSIRGIRPKGAARPVLDGKGLGTVVTVNASVTVSIASLTITGGTGTPCGDGCTLGGGILNRGTLTLAGVTVRGNAAKYGGGIDNEGGAVTLSGRSTVRDNTATGGGGVTSYGRGTVTLTDGASVHHNTARRGGGADLGGGTLVLQGSASVHHNSASRTGGGVYSLSGTLTIGDQGSIHRNTAKSGGGYYNDGGATSGDYCAIGSLTDKPIRVNTPENCVTV